MSTEALATVRALIKELENAKHEARNWLNPNISLVVGIDYDRWIVELRNVVLDLSNQAAEQLELEPEVVRFHEIRP